ncbi:hypothetical protein [Ahrensia sp. R2A130]|uniref:hypothetical protein n=1 Tax=Ahrensia sp. R2A130 TaxID=744979 RepID=UPI0001E0E8DC|nr:hypothetical protein [Ahrensia sp. R2A130]EFL87990.1 CoB--CoM heterodisulfide reductase subunit E [Ahrensia sp. R2A130]
MLATRCLAIFLFGLLTLATFQSSAIVTTTYDLPESEMNERVVLLAETWHGWMQELGLAGITEAISEQLEEWREQTIAAT